MPDRALIIGSRQDEHVGAVLSAMGSWPAPVVLDAALLEHGRFRLDAAQLELGADSEGHDVPLSGARGWVRRLSEPRWRPGIVSGSRDAAVRGAWIALVAALASHPEVEWLTPYPALIGAENKLRQAAHAARLGLRTPRTVVASDPVRIPAELGDVLVVKPLGAGRRAFPAHRRRGACAVGSSAVAGRSAPISAGRRTISDPGAHHRSPAPASRDGQGSGLELRARRGRSASRLAARRGSTSCLRPGAGPGPRERRASAGRRPGLGYSSQDWIDTGDGAVFVDLNPAGQWLFSP